MPVSELEKNAEQASRKISSPSRKPGCTLSTVDCLDVQDEFANQLAAEIRQDQQAEPRQRPANGLVSAPAELVATPEQHGEDHPGEAGEDGFVQQMLGKQVVDEQRTGEQR